MNKWQGIQAFWESFGIPAYDQNSVPDDAVMPYITYVSITAPFENAVPLEGYIWYLSTKWEEPSLKADEIAEALSPYKLIELDDGQYIYMAQGSPFAQRVADTNDLVKRIYINVMAEFLTRK